MLCAPPGAAGGVPPGQAEPVARRGARTAGSSGTLPFESLAGVRAAAEYMLELDFEAVRAHEEALLRQRARRACARWTT